MRIHQFLSKSGLFPTKEKAILAIKSGQIKVGNKTMLSEQYMFNERKERVYYKNEHVTLKDKQLIALNKPKGYICAKLKENDRERGKKSVYDLLPKNMQHLSCVGRLDEQSSGLLFMTNDGELHQEIISKENNISKKYIVQVEKELTNNDCIALAQGIIITLEENGSITEYKTKPCRVKKIDDKKIEIILSEGKKRQIRRMIKAINNEVIQLERIQIGQYVLDKNKISQGKYVELKNDEIK